MFEEEKNHCNIVLKLNPVKLAPLFWVEKVKTVVGCSYNCFLSGNYKKKHLGPSILELYHELVKTASIHVVN